MHCVGISCLGLGMSCESEAIGSLTCLALACRASACLALACESEAIGSLSEAIGMPCLGFRE
ncbi:unnamed protein product [Prunus armeniaca]|uniref:Uncharacterized protein n=1 Tax=Prunus armeniaca TaxID=36596 RepID=A0A6J5THU4_PRUAR|nr:unnamed protein product [Prunus armeniaca]